MSTTAICPHCMAEVDGSSELCPVCGKPLNAENQENQLAIGSVLENRYLIGSAIGDGGFGIVYVGFDIMLGVKVAVKEYYPAGAANRDFNGCVTPVEDGDESFQNGQARFRKEAELMSLFAGDKNVVSVRDVFDANGTSYIVMEFVEGQDLNELLREHGTFTMSQALELTEPVRRCLACVHEKGIVHCDVSPSNIILSGDGVLKLLDFGAARRMDERDEHSGVLKHGYAPEELYRPDGECGAWTDVYSFSAMLYKLTTNELPEAATDRLFKDVLKRPSQLGAKLTPAQEMGLLKGLSLRAKDRPQSMDALRAEIDKQPERKSGKNGQPGKKKNLILILIVLAIVAACIGIAIAGGINTRSSSGSSGTKAAVENTGAQREKPEKLVLSENAYPIQMIAGLEPVEGFEPQYLLDNEFVSCRVDNVLYGNRQLCLFVTKENKTDADAYIDISIDATDRTISDDYTRGKDIFYMKGIETQESVLFWNTDELYFNGITALQNLDFHVSWNSDADTENVSWNEYKNSHFLHFPGIIRMENDLSSLKSFFSGAVENGNMSLETYGCSLLKDHYEGLLVIDCTKLDYPDYSDDTKYASFQVVEVLADGKEVTVSDSNRYSSFTNGDLSLSCSSWESKQETFFLKFPYAKDQVTVDEMNVMHTGKGFPKEIELKLGINIYASGEYSDNFEELATLRFSIDDNGAGHLVN